MEISKKMVESDIPEFLRSLTSFQSLVMAWGKLFWLKFGDYISGSTILAYKISL